MFTDTHCHIYDTYYDDIDGVIKSAGEKGINKMINNASDRESCLKVLELSEKIPNVYPALGFHPEVLSNTSEIDLNLIEKNIDRIVAIGEIGLDYHYGKEDREKQLQLFESQLELAEKYDKPVIVHSREATEDTINILKKYPKVRGSIHCFSGSLETAKIYLSLGYKLGFGGVTTFKNAKIKAVIKELPLDAILLETDSPYLSPEPVRGTKNEPKNVHYIAKFIADIKGISLEELSAATEENVRELFDI